MLADRFLFLENSDARVRKTPGQAISGGEPDDSTADDDYVSGVQILRV